MLAHRRSCFRAAGADPAARCRRAWVRAACGARSRGAGGLGRVLLSLVFVPPFAQHGQRLLPLGRTSASSASSPRSSRASWSCCGSPTAACASGPRVRDGRAAACCRCWRWALCFFALVAVETDLGGAMLLLLVCLRDDVGRRRAPDARRSARSTAIGGDGADRSRFTAIPTCAGASSRSSASENQQISDGLAGDRAAAASSASGLGQGLYRNQGVPYLESDFVFAPGRRGARPRRACCSCSGSSRCSLWYGAAPGALDPRPLLPRWRASACWSRSRCRRCCTCRSSPAWRRRRA